MKTTFEKSDFEFLKVLDHRDKLEKQMAELRTVRMIAAVTATFAVIALFVIFFMCIRTGLPPAWVLMGGIFLLPVIQAMMAHHRLRRLMMFNKLRDDKRVVTP